MGFIHSIFFQLLSRLLEQSVHILPGTLARQKAVGGNALVRSHERGPFFASDLAQDAITGVTTNTILEITLASVPSLYSMFIDGKPHCRISGIITVVLCSHQQ